MIRLFIPHENLIVSQFLVLKGSSHRKISKVLRLQVGQDIGIFNNTGHEFLAKIVEIETRSSKLLICEKMKIDSREYSKISIALSVMKGKRFDWAIQKMTELGVHHVIPLLSERCVFPSVSSTKLERWKKIIEEACRQCGRVSLPILSNPTKFEAFLSDKSIDADLKIFLSPTATSNLETTLNTSKFKSALVLIGPEGGWSEKEISQAVKEGFHSVSLGHSILRSETAPLVITTLLQNHFGFFS